MDYKKKRLQKGKVIKLFVNSVFLFFDSSQPMRTQETLGLSGALKSDSGKNSNSKKKKEEEEIWKQNIANFLVILFIISICK